MTDAYNGDLHASLKGKTIIVTSGPTRAWLDPVRYFANESSGRLGAIIADTCQHAGARVIYIYGSGAVLPETPSIQTIPIVTVEDLMKVLQKQIALLAPAAVIHAMAVLDYQPTESLKSKHPSGDPLWTITLEPTPKVINSIKQLCPDTVLVGFKLGSPGDTVKLLQSAQQVMLSSDADLVVANFPPPPQPDQHLAYFLDKNALTDLTSEPPHRLGKQLIAEYLCLWLAQKLSG